MEQDGRWFRRICALRTAVRSLELGTIALAGLTRLRDRQVHLANLDDGLVTAEQLQLPQDFGHVGLHGGFGKLKLDRDFPILLTEPDQLEYAQLLRGELAQPRLQGSRRRSVA